MFFDAGHVVFTSPFGPVRFEVEIARTPLAQRVGLSGRSELPEGRGMLFELRRPTLAVMTMRETLMDLDIVFVDERRRVSAVSRGVAGSSGPLYSASLSSWVVELPAGSAERYGIGPGTWFSTG